MIPKDLCFGQRFDPELNILQPWYTHGCLDEIQTWDLSDKVVLEFGAGFSTYWYAHKCKHVYSIDTDEEWYNKLLSDFKNQGIDNKATIRLRKVNEGDQSKADYYMGMPEDCKPDIIVNDGILRTEVCQMAVDYFRNKGGGILICDNWQQSYVWMSPAAAEIMAPFEAKIYEQADHTDNDGVNKWKTAIFYIK